MSAKPTGNTIPPEILLQVFSLLSPRDFDNARHICSQWMRVSLDQRLLESMLKRAGWWDAWQHDSETGHASPSESLVWRMSKRFSTECLLSGRKTNVEKPGFLTTGVVDFSRLALLLHSVSVSGGQDDNGDGDGDGDGAVSSQFSVSMCGNYVLVISGHRILVYRLLPRPHGLSDALSVTKTKAKPRDKDITLVASVVCPDTVLSATIDTSASHLVVAALLHGRVGMVCDITAHPVSPDDNIQQYHYYHDVCSPEDPPRSIALCPGLGLGRRRCVAFGATAGIELRWTDDTSPTQHEYKKHFAMTQPSEILHFLPVQSDATPDELRLVSSMSGPANNYHYQHHQHTHTDRERERERETPSTNRNRNRNSGKNSVRATHCHHYRAVPVNDGIHILFIEPQSGFLCIGSDAPIGGPTDLTRALVCTPPFPASSSTSDTTTSDTTTSTTPSSDTTSNTSPTVPGVFAAGSDLSWGLRVVAAYDNRLVLYSVPLDVFNVVRKERERQGDDVLAGSDLARDWFLDTQHQHQHPGNNQGQGQGQGQGDDGDGNDDWEFLLAVSYRPTAMLWPLKIYGKEIGRVDDVVELALQSSHGGARVWAFRASGETHIIDVDTFTSPARAAGVGTPGTGTGTGTGTPGTTSPGVNTGLRGAGDGLRGDTTGGIPCTSSCVDSDGSVESARVVVGEASRSRASSDSYSDSSFKGQFFTPGCARVHYGYEDEDDNENVDDDEDDDADRRMLDGPFSSASAACIVGFNIEEVGC